MEGRGTQADIRKILAEAMVVMFPAEAAFISPPKKDAPITLDFNLDGKTVMKAECGAAITFIDSDKKSVVIMFKNMELCETFIQTMQFNVSQYLASGYR